MKKYYKGQYIEMTEEELAEIEKETEQFAAHASIEDELADIKASLNKLTDMLSAFIKG